MIYFKGKRMKILHWKYVKSGTKDDVILDAMSEDCYPNQIYLANELGLSTRTIERAISKYKDEGKLTVFRGRNNDMYYCIGEDIKGITNVYDAINAYDYRCMIEDGCVTQDPKCEVEVKHHEIDPIIFFDKPEDLCNQNELDEVITKLGY